MSDYVYETLSDEVYECIRQYCIARNYKCTGCRYSYRYIVPKEHPGYDKRMCCIFDNCPSSWEPRGGKDGQNS